MTKAIITGGAGFIGSNLADALLADGQEVHVIDDLSLGRRENLSPDVVFHEGSVLDGRLLAEVLDGADHVYHEAALGSVPRSIQDPLASHMVNSTGTLSVLEAARHAEVEKVVYAASSSAYGDTPTLPKVETMTPNPKSPYAVAKLSGEQYCQVFHAVYGLRTTCLRYFNVYGPRQSPTGAYAAVIPKFIEAALEGRDLSIHGDGTNSRDFTFVADVVNANRLAARSRDADGEVINIGAGGRTTLNELAGLILAAAESQSRVIHGPERPGDVAHSLADLEKAKQLLGYEPAHDVRAGIEKTVAWFAETATAASTVETS